MKLIIQSYLILFVFTFSSTTFGGVNGGSTPYDFIDSSGPNPAQAKEDLEGYSYQSYIDDQTAFAMLNEQFYSQEVADQMGASLYVAALKFVMNKGTCAGDRTCEVQFDSSFKTLKKHIKSKSKFIKAAKLMESGEGAALSLDESSPLANGLISNQFQAAVASLKTTALTRRAESAEAGLVAQMFAPENADTFNSFINDFQSRLEANNKQRRLLKLVGILVLGAVMVAFGAWLLFPLLSGGMAAASLAASAYGAAADIFLGASMGIMGAVVVSTYSLSLFPSVNNSKMGPVLQSIQEDYVRMPLRSVYYDVIVPRVKELKAEQQATQLKD